METENLLIITYVFLDLPQIGVYDADKKESCASVNRKSLYFQYQEGVYVGGIDCRCHRKQPNDLSIPNALAHHRNLPKLPKNRPSSLPVFRLTQLFSPSPPFGFASALSTHLLCCLQHCYQHCHTYVVRGLSAATNPSPQSASPSSAACLLMVVSWGVIETRRSCCSSK